MQRDSIAADLTGELADAVRKSWSESQQNSTELQSDSRTAAGAGGGSGSGGGVASDNTSPIGTPMNSAIFSTSPVTASRPGLGEHRYNSAVGPTELFPTLKTTTNTSAVPFSGSGEPATLSSAAAVNEQANVADYQLFKRHYSLTGENSETITDILNDLDLEPSDAPSEQLADSTSQGLSVDSQRASMRRSSLKNVPWVRQLMNPRTSFSAASSNEPSFLANTTEEKGWVTILDNNTPALLRAVIILYQSLKEVASKYNLFVLHTKDVDVSPLSNLHIHTICMENAGIDDGNGNSTPVFPNFEHISRSWSKLFLFTTLINVLDLACYLSPTCMVLENIDELLDSEEICNEIDNETCVLLTNDTVGQHEGVDEEEDPQIIILKPSHEIHMCIKEFFTLYGDHDRQRKQRLMETEDLEVLSQLFHESWGRISSQGYCIRINKDSPLQDPKPYKIADYKGLLPLICQEDTKQLLQSPIYQRWQQLWAKYQHTQV